MQYSPKLKTAMEQIKKILKENDIAGVVVLHTVSGHSIAPDKAIDVQGFTEYLFHINTSYSAAQIENDKFLVNAHSKHYNSLQERDIKIASSINMLESLSQWTSDLALQTIELQNIVNTYTESVKFDNNNDQGSTHIQQNN